jgi:hypothetical protein
MPDGWETWPQKRRTLWRREQQLARMRQMQQDGYHDAARLAVLIEDMGRQVAELRQQGSTPDDSD